MGDRSHDRESGRLLALECVRRVQQFSGPVMAKGLEDTALYRYNRLVALNEVGERPDRFTSSIAQFHDANRSRLERSPNGMLASSSHDTKRGEDTRARLAALTGNPERGFALVKDLDGAMMAAGAPAISPDDRYVFFQHLFGAAPTALDISDPSEVEPFRDRLQAAMLKSIAKSASIPIGRFLTRITKRPCAVTSIWR